MNKFKILSLSLVAIFSLGISGTFSSVQAASLTPEVSVASEDTILHIVRYPYQTTSAKWVTVYKNGKTYSGYVYYRGYDNGGCVFSGTLSTAPYAPATIGEQE